MSWLVWRQHRFEILGLLIGAVLIAAALLYGADLATRIRAELGVDTCQPLPNTNANCVNLSMQAAERMQPFRWLVILLFFVPAVVGSFVGGPLFARELERGTHRLIWTQGITRTRWGAAKLFSLLGVGALAASMVASVGGLATTINGGWANVYQNFDLEGPAFVSYVLFAITVATFAGTLSRRILVGMFAGLLLFGIVRLGVLSELRPNYEPPVTVVYGASVPSPQSAVPADSWLVGIDFIDHTGRVVPWARVRSIQDASRPQGGRFPDFLEYMAQNDAYQRVRFQPADRYWRFQWTEGLLFLVLSGALSVTTLLLLKRRDA